MNTKYENPIHLILNCSDALLQVVLGTREHLLWSQNIRTPGQAMKYIAPTIKSGLDFLGIRPDQLSAVSCVSGPGSFTGVRMVYAHAHGLSLAADIPITSISSFDALIHGPGRLLQGHAWIFIHSRRGQVYARGYSLPAMQALSQPANMNIMGIDRLADPASEKTTYAFGSGVRRNPDRFTSRHWTILSPSWDVPSPQSLLSLSFNEDSFSLDPYPQYLRPSDAEESLSAKQSKQPDAGCAHNPIKKNAAP